MSRFALALVSVGALCAGAAFAEEEEAAAGPGHGKPAFMATYDSDADGAVTRAEFDAVRLEGFAVRDADGDGVISRAEYAEEFAARLTGVSEEERLRQMRQTDVRFDNLDEDEDGAMSAAEFADSGAWMFKTLDTTGDGVVDASDDAEAY